MSYSIEFKAEALSQLEMLNQKAQQRVLRKIRWVVENFDQLNPQALTGNLSGLFKLRIGDCRALYSFTDDTEIITIHRIAYHSEVYL